MILALALACSSPAPAPQEPAGPIRVRLALNWMPEPEFGGFYEGVLGGHYEKAGFQVEILPGGPGAPSLELMVAGRADVAITAADDLLLKREKGIAAIGAWPAFQLSPQGLMVHTDSGITRFDQIRGGRIAIELGSPFQRYLWKRFGWEGVVEAVPTTGTIAPFLADPELIQSAYITSEPCLARAQGVEVTFLKASDAGWNPYGTLVAFPDPPPAWAGAFVEATEAAWKAYMADPSRANAEIARLNDQMRPDLLECITTAQEHFLTGEDGLGSMTLERWEQAAANLRSVGLLPEGRTAQGAWRTFR